MRIMFGFFACRRFPQPLSKRLGDKPAARPPYSPYFNNSRRLKQFAAFCLCFILSISRLYFMLAGVVTLAPLLTFIDHTLYHFCSLFCHYNSVEQYESWFHIIIHWLYSTGSSLRLLQVTETFKALYLFGRQGLKLPSCFADIHKIL